MNEQEADKIIEYFRENPDKTVKEAMDKFNISMPIAFNLMKQSVNNSQ